MRDGGQDGPKKLSEISCCAFEYRARIVYGLVFNVSYEKKRDDKDVDRALYH